MDFHGVLPKFKVDRVLNADEREHKLEQGECLNIGRQSLDSDTKVIMMNSNFLELVDKNYFSRGFLSLIGSVFCVMLSVALLFLLWSIFKDGGAISSYELRFIFAFSLIAVPLIVLTIYIVMSECFSFTHYPIRFDRENRQVLFFRLDGTIRNEPWDKVFFTSGLGLRKSINQEYYISGHILADDGETVIDTFCMPATSSDRKELERHWEFVRRYMEEGPESVSHVVNFCLPIYGKREGYQFGLIILMSAYNGATFYLLPLIFTLSFILSIPRYIAMVTSKVPVWPESIEEQCAVLENDPYAVDASINSKHPWRDMFRKQPEDE